MLNFFKSKVNDANINGLFADARRHQNHLHQELPYRDYDSEDQIYYNNKSKGFGLKISVLGGANDELIMSLNKVVMEFPQGDKWDYQCSLFGHNRVAHYIEANGREMAARGGICERLAVEEVEYAKFGARNGFFHKQKNNRFDLRDYDAYFFVSTTEKQLEKLLDVRAALETALMQLGIESQRLETNAFVTFVNDILNFDPKRSVPNDKPYSEYEPINQQVISKDSEYIIKRDHIKTRHTNDSGEECRNRIVSMGLSRAPSDFRLYALPEAFGSIRNISRMLLCPHVFTISFRQTVTGSFEHANNKKITDLMKTVGSKMAVLTPHASDELEERKALQKSVASKEITICSMVANLVLFTHKANHRRDVQAAKEAFRAIGLDMKEQIMMQSQSLLGALPFVMSEGVWDDCVRAGRIRTLKSSNLVNFLPIALDFKRLTSGMLLPTMRGQISYFDPFNCGSDNKNIALTGGSGAGKSYFTQGLARSVYAKGGKVWILDKGDSYRKLTLMLGGTYLNHKKIFLNPFTHLHKIMEQSQHDEDGSVDPMKEALSNITALFATIASPNTELEGIQTAVLGDAILAAWKDKGSETKVDDVQNQLFELAKSDNDRRIKDIAVQLNKFCTNGIYGDTFNKPSMLDPDCDITTLELDGFADDVLRPVVFALIVSINQQMYLSGSRSTPKMCIIEEAWSLMSGTNAQTRSFINTGYRTARKFGGSFCTVTQGVGDFFVNEEAKASYDNSDIHITLRQGEGFEKFLQEYPTVFNDMEKVIIQSFPRASQAGYSCVRIKAGGHTTYHRVFSDPFTRSCYSTETKEFEFTLDLTNKGMGIMESIEETSQHFYGQEIEQYQQALKRQDECYEV